MRSMIWRRRLEEEVKKKIKSMEEMKQTSCQLEKNHVLEAEYRELLSEKSAENEWILDEKIKDLKIRMEAELKEKRRAEENSKLAHKIEVLERDKGVLESQQLSNKEVNKDKDRLVEQVKEAMRRAEEAEKCHSENLKMIQVLKRDKEALEAHILKVDKEKSVAIVRIALEKMALQDEKRRLEEEHVKAMEVLEAKLEAQVRKVQNGKGNESDRIVVLVKALGDQKRRADSADKQVSECLEKIRVLLKVDNKDKRNEMETKFRQADKVEKHKEIERILNTMEDEGMKKRIEVLEREKKEMETKFCQLDKEKRAMKDDYEKKNLELVDRISILEAEIIDKDDGIKVFYEGLEDVKNDLVMAINGSASKMKEGHQVRDNID